MEENRNILWSPKNNISKNVVYIGIGMIFLFEVFLGIFFGILLEVFLLPKSYTIEMTTLMIVTLSANHLTDHEYKTALAENFFWHSLRFKYKLCLCSLGITFKAAAALALHFFFASYYISTQLFIHKVFVQSFSLLLMRSFFSR